MKIKMILFVFLIALFIKLLINSVLCLPGLAEIIIAKINNDEVITRAKVVGYDVNGITTVEYETEEGIITSTSKNLYVLKMGEEIEISYSKSNPHKIFIFNSVCVLYIFFMYLIYAYIKTNPYFYDIICKIRAKRWKKAEFDYVDIEDFQNGWCSIEYSMEKDGKKVVGKVLDSSSIIKVLIEKGIINKVPVLIHPKNTNKKCIDINTIEQKVRLNKSLIQCL